MQRKEPDKKDASISRQLDSLFESNKHPRSVCFYIASTLGILFAAAYTVYSVLNDSMLVVNLFRMIVAILAIANIVILLIGKKAQLLIHVFMAALQSLLILLLFYGKPQLGEIYWFFSVPAILFFLFGAKRAMVWMALLFLLTAGSVLLHVNEIVTFVAYTPRQVLTMCMVLAIISVIAVIAEQCNECCFSGILKKHKEVEDSYRKTQIELAETIQRSLIPHDDVIANEYELSFFYKAAYGVGGDYFDYFDMGDDSLGIVMCDVVGKGVPAALMMTSVRTIIKNLINDGITDPANIINVLNSVFRNDFGGEFYLTFAFVLYNIKKSTIRFYNAGHSPFIYYSQIENVMKEIELDGYPIGLFEVVNKKMTYITVKLFPGDIVVLFSDGLTDHIDSNNYQRARTKIFTDIQRNCKKTASEIKDYIVEKYLHHKPESTHTMKDDVALVIFKVKSSETS